jgi:hypothetical protein
MCKLNFLLLLLFACFLVVPESRAQKGLAPDGDYPATYPGNTFTGVLQPVSKASSEFTLIYTKNGKPEQFTAQLEAKCALTDKTDATQRFGIESFVEGSVLTAYYMTSKAKDTSRRKILSSLSALPKKPERKYRTTGKCLSFAPSKLNFRSKPSQSIAPALLRRQLPRKFHTQMDKSDRLSAPLLCAPRAGLPIARTASCSAEFILPAQAALRTW